MIRTKFDPKRRYLCLVYLRMSSDKQNPRSPEQQLATIKETLHLLNLDWIIVAIYREDPQTAKMTRRRPQYQSMIQDLKLKRVQADLVLVDTFERLSRATSAPAERDRFRRLGLLVLSADSHFTAPVTTGGRALAAFEELRASADGEVKAHNVLRGKRDAVRRGRWPGGPPPLGYKLEIVVVADGRRAGDSYSKLIPDPTTQIVPQEAFRLAREYGFGRDRITQALNADSRIPQDLKPLKASTIAYILENQIYMGEFVWGKTAKDIVDDVYKVESQPVELWERLPDFCEPLVSREDWLQVESLRLARAKLAKQAAQAATRRIGIPGLHSPGIALKYPLTGLVRCQLCKRSMTPSSSSPFVKQSGEVKRYVAYACPAHSSGLCSNGTRIPEDWLRATITQLIRMRLFLN